MMRGRPVCALTEKYLALGLPREQAMRMAHRERSKKRYARIGFVPPVGRQRERRRIYNAKWMSLRRKEKASEVVLCFFCRVRRAKEEVVRLCAEENGFRRVQVPYCGEC